MIFATSATSRRMSAAKRSGEGLVRGSNSAASSLSRPSGEFTAFTGFNPAGTHPDAAQILDFFFGADRDYWKDPMILKNIELGEAEFDDKKRTALYTPILDKVNQEAYIFPISELPIVWAHHKDIFLKANPLSNSLPMLGRGLAGNER